MQLKPNVCLIFLRKSFVVNRLQILKDMRRGSLLVLRKNLRRNHLRFNCMLTAKAKGPIDRTAALVAANCPKR